MKRFYRSICVLPCVAAIVAPLDASARAAAAPEAAAPASSAIIMGEEVEGCGWPTTVAVKYGSGFSLCTGTLIHEEIVIYAAHCGDGDIEIGLGNVSLDPPQLVTTEYCSVNPEYDGDEATDFAFCKLAAPITGIPITPPLMGCEGAEYLQPGSDVAIAGFGSDSIDGGFGIKRWAITTLQSVAGKEAVVGGDPDPGPCPGDSGGPAYVQLADGSWRVFGIASTVEAGCGGKGRYALVPAAIPWIEAESSIDVTPCHTATGLWEPTSRCTGFALSGPQGSGAWERWCAGLEASGPSSTCGEPYDANPDVTAPAVSIVDPLDQAEFAAADPVSIVIDADDGDGSGVVQVWASIDGVDQPAISEPPYEYAQVQLPVGVHTLIATAEDAAGLTGESSPVTIFVGVDPNPSTTGTGPDPDTGTTDDETTGATDSSAGQTTAGADAVGDDDGGEGCSCRSHHQAPLDALVTLTLLGRVRRRRRAFNASGGQG